MLRVKLLSTLEEKLKLTFEKLLEAQTDCCLVIFYFKVYWHLRQFFSAIGASAVVTLDDFVGRFQIFSVIENEFAFLTDYQQRH